MATPWYKAVTPRPEVAEGRSFHPDEFAIALEQVVAGIAPEDYTDPAKFFSRTSFTRALSENVGLVLRRLSGQTTNTAPVLTLLTQFGGGKTHTLTTLYHLARSGDDARSYPGIAKLLADVLLPSIPKAKLGVFVGNAWDPQAGAETPWIDLARQLAGDAGVALLGPAAATAPPGTETLQRLFAAANAPVLLLFDEVLNFINRHRNMADPFYAFIQNLTVAMTGTTECAMVISLPRSQVEMTEWDAQWQERITKVVRRVASNLIANDEAEIADVVRRRLFEELGSEQARLNVATAYADWCFQNRAQLPPEWTAVDTASSETEVREYLRQRFLSAYPFHPATLSVFHRKWSSVAQFQATRGTLAMLAQWVSMAYRDGFTYLRNEPLHHARVGAPARPGIPRRRARPVGREPAAAGDRRRHRRAAPPTPGRWTWTPRTPCVTSTAAWVRPSSLSRRAARSTGRRICPNCALPSAVPTWIRRPSTARPTSWRTNPSTFARSALTAIRSATGRR